MSYSSAVCSFCSREDSSVKVVCKKYCLICHRCQVLPATRQLLIDHYKVNDPNSYTSRSAIEDITEEVLEKSQCPLCGSHMTRNMFITVQSLMESVIPEEGSKISMFIELDLGYKQNIFKEFVVYFKLTYGNIGYEIKTDILIDKNKLLDFSSNANNSSSQLNRSNSKFSLSESSEENGDDNNIISSKTKIVSSRPNSGFNKTRPVSSNSNKLKSPKGIEDENNNSRSLVVQLRPQSSNSNRPKSPKRTEDESNMNIQSLPAIPQQSPQAPNVLGKIDYYASLPPTLGISEGLNVIAESFIYVWQSLIRGINDSISAAVSKICHRKKSSTRSNDFKLKSFLDFIISVNSVNNPNRSATTLLFGKLIGTSPRLNNNVRPVLGSIATIILVIGYCSIANSQDDEESFDVMNGTPTVNEFKVKLDRFSITKSISIRRAIQIIEYLIRTQQPHWNMAPLMVNVVGQGGKLAWGKDSISRLIHLLIYVIQGDSSAENDLTLDNRLNNNKAYHNMSFATVNTTNNQPANHLNLKTAGSNSSKQVYKRLMASHNKAKELWEAVSNDQWKNKLDPTSLGLIIYCENNINQSNNNNMMSSLKQVNINNLLNDLTIPSYNQSNQSSLASQYLKSAKFKSKSLGKGVFSNIILSEFFDLFGDKSINISEFIYVCTTAWEEEYEMLLKHQNNSEFAKTRRDAVTSVFDKNNLNLSLNEKSSLRKILKYWNYCIEHNINIYEKEHKLNKGSTIDNKFENHVDKKKEVLSKSKTNYFNRLRSNSKNQNLRKSIQLNRSLENDSIINEIENENSVDELYEAKEVSQDNDKNNHENSNNLKKLINLVDWDIVCKLAKKNLLPFDVPELIYSKTPAELNHHIILIIKEDEQKLLQEAAEDESVSNHMNGPYSQLNYFIDPNDRLVNSRSKDTIDEPIVLIDNEKQSIVRANYLSNKTLGFSQTENEPVDMKNQLIDSLNLPDSNTIQLSRYKSVSIEDFTSSSLIHDQNLSSRPQSTRNQNRAVSSLSPILSPARKNDNFSTILSSKRDRKSIPNSKTIDLLTEDYKDFHHVNPIYPKKIYSSPVPSKYEINLVDLIDFHPNLLTKVKLLEKNEIINLPNGRYSYQSSSDLDESRPSTANDVNRSNSSNMTKILSNHKERLLYGSTKIQHNHRVKSANVLNSIKTDRTVFTELDEPIFYRPMNELSNYESLENKYEGHENRYEYDGDDDINEMKKFHERIEKFNKKIIEKSVISNRKSFVDIDEIDSKDDSEVAVNSDNAKSTVETHYPMTRTTASTTSSPKESKTNSPISKDNNEREVKSNGRNRRRSHVFDKQIKDTNKYEDWSEQVGNEMTNTIEEDRDHFIVSLSLEYHLFINELYNKNKLQATPDNLSTNIAVKKMNEKNYLNDTTLSITNFPNLNIDKDFNLFIESFVNKIYKNLNNLYITSCNLNYKASEIFSSSYLNQSCNLIELNISFNNLGDKGCKNILNSIVQGNGHLLLLKLNIRNNNIALACNSMIVLREFKNLMYLDLSNNRICVDITRQTELFCKIFESLKSLRVLSLANNTLQDNAIEQIYKIMYQSESFATTSIGSFSSNTESVKLNAVKSNHIVMLDVAKCYLTAKSLPYIQKIIDSKNCPLREIWINNNMFTSDQLKKLKYVKYSSLKSLGNSKVNTPRSVGFNLKNYEIQSSINSTLTFVKVHIDDNYIDLNDRTEFTIDYLKSL